MRLTTAITFPNNSICSRYRDWLRAVWSRGQNSNPTIDMIFFSLCRPNCGPTNEQQCMTKECWTQGEECAWRTEGSQITFLRRNKRKRRLKRKSSAIWGEQHDARRNMCIRAGGTELIKSIPDSVNWIIWLRVRSSGGLLWTWWQTFTFTFSFRLLCGLSMFWNTFQCSQHLSLLKSLNHYMFRPKLAILRC
jgi:hypothetical protein